MEAPFIQNHEVYRVTLKTGEEYVLDITGAQYGFDQVVMPWDEYLILRAGRVHHVSRNGFQEAKLDAYMKMARARGRDKYNTNLYEDILKQQWLFPVIRTSLLAWLVDVKNMTLPVVLQVPTYPYRMAMDKFAAVLDEDIVKLLAQAEKQVGVAKMAELEGTREKMIDRCKAYHAGDANGNEASIRKAWACFP